MSSGKNPRDFVQLLDNHIFFNDITDELLFYFFKVLIKKDEDHGYDDKENLVNESLLKKKMFEYLLNDTKLLMENIPKVLFLVKHSADLSEEEKQNITDDLNKKIDESNNRLKSTNIGDIINKQFDKFTD